jgi:hypothetical protein
MAVFRVNKNTNYTVMSNYHLRDKNLSLKAKGLLSLMLSLPPDWDYTVAGLCAICKEGRGSVRTALIELEELGYLKRTTVRDEKGHFSDQVYDIFEVPDVQNPPSENWTSEKWMSENRPQINKEEQNKEIQNKEEYNSNKLLLDKSKKYGDGEINEMFSEWERRFGYMPKQSKQNRYAVYNMLRASNKGKEWLLNTMDLLLEAQKDKYAGNAVLGIADFADLQRSYDKIWKWGSGKAMRNQELIDEFEI